MIFFDEAGNSGDNLLDLHQPVYMLLSHDFTEGEAREILKPILAVSSASELHFKTVRKHYKQQLALLEVFRSPLITTERVYAFAGHKEFMIVIQIVNQLIEHVLYKRGIDLYKGGSNISTANVIYMLGTGGWNKPLFDRMCESFVHWNRSKLQEDGLVFYESVLALHKSIDDKEEKGFTRLILDSAPYMKFFQKTFEKYWIDATFPCFVKHCHYWSKRYANPLGIVFDQSKQMTHWDGMIKFLTTLPDVQVGYGSRKHNAALKIKTIEQMESKDSIQLQLADLLASAMNYYNISIVRRNEDKFAEQISEVLGEKIIMDKIWPGLEVTPEELGMADTDGINPIDFFADFAKSNLESYKKARPKQKEK